MTNPNPNPAHRSAEPPRPPRDRALIVAAIGVVGLLLANVFTHGCNWR